MSVYFAEVGPYIKVGYSANPERRVRNLFKSHTRYTAPADAPKDKGSRRLICSVPGELDEEALVHAALEDFLVGCEWYVNEPALHEWIGQYVATGRIVRAVRDGGPARLFGEDALSPDEKAALAAVLDRLFQAPHPST